MSNNNQKSKKGAGLPPPPANTTGKAKKAADRHRQAIAEAANLNSLNSATNGLSLVDNQSSSNNNDSLSSMQNDDYESGKVTKQKRANYQEEVNMVKDLDRWG